MVHGSLSCNVFVSFPSNLSGLNIFGSFFDNRFTFISTIKLQVTVIYYKVVAGPIVRFVNFAVCLDWHQQPRGVTLKLKHGF